jgi:hypothetical protein
VLANVRVLFGLVTTRSSRADDDAVESMLGVACFGAVADCQGVAIDHPGVTTDR